MHSHPSAGPAALAWIAALTPDGQPIFRDVSSLLGDHPCQMLAVLRERTGRYVDRVRVHSRAGQLLLYFSEVGSCEDRLPFNPYAHKLVLGELGMDLGDYHGTFLILGEQNNREAGLTEPQREFLRDVTASTVTV